MAAHRLKITFEFGTERGVLDIVDGTVKTFLFTEKTETATSRAEMGMIVHTEEQVKHTIIIRGYAKKSAHVLSFCSLIFPKIPR